MNFHAATKVYSISHPPILFVGKRGKFKETGGKLTEWVRVPVDTDSMSTINTGTFRGIGTQSSSITDRNDNEDYNVNFRFHLT